MTHSPPRVSDHEVEQVVGRLLQLGVLIAAVVVLIGGVMLLVQRGGTPVASSVFHAEPDNLRSIVGIIRGVASMQSESIVQLGLLLLIATPVARVAFTLVAFVLQRDRTYIVVTTIVLALLLYGLVFGNA
ncbi:MAG TPA: DUF1634 domain-containing protein [Gemmatimonadaceae bacterium]